MKKFFSFLLMFTILLGGSFMLVGCEGHNQISTLMFTFNRITYTTGADIAFQYQEDMYFNKDTVKFISINDVNTQQNIDIKDLEVTYEYKEAGKDNFVKTLYFPFFEGQATRPACGVYRFTFKKEKGVLQFTITITKNDPIYNYKVVFYSDTANVISTSNTSYVINAADSSSINWKVTGMTIKESEQLGNFPELYVMTPTQYNASHGRSTYNGTLIDDLYGDIFSVPGEYYIYGKFEETTNYIGGNTIATYLIVR